MYNEAKRFAEALASAYRSAGVVDVGILRIFNTYGPRMRPDDGRVVVNFITQALCGAPLTIYGDGQQTRSLCFVDDLIRGVVAMLDSAEFGPINLGNPQELTIRSLADMVLLATGSASPIEHHALPEDDPVRRRPAIDRAEYRLGWLPTIGIDNGLQRTVEWFRSRSAATYVPRDDVIAVD